VTVVPRSRRERARWFVGIETRWLNIYAEAISALIRSLGGVSRGNRCGIVGL